MHGMWKSAEYLIINSLKWSPLIGWELKKMWKIDHGRQGWVIHNRSRLGRVIHNRSRLGRGIGYTVLGSNELFVRQHMKIKQFIFIKWLSTGHLDSHLAKSQIQSHQHLHAHYFPNKLLLAWSVRLKQAVRAITNSDHRAHSAPLISKLGILEMYQLNTFQIAKFMYFYHNNLLPPYFFNLFFYKQSNLWL